MDSDRDEDRVKGPVDQLKGTVKKAVGEITGDGALFAEGEEDQRDDRRRGKAQNPARKATDPVRRA